MRPPSPALALLAALAAAPALARAAAPAASKPQPPREEEPCEPVKPCEIPLDDGPAAPEAAPADFTAEVKALFAIVSCGGAPAPAAVEAKAVQAFCAKQSKALAAWRAKALPERTALLARVRPASAPSAVVYPFGAGDLLAALTTWPDARNVTTLGPEPVGDPRRLAALLKEKAGARELERIEAASAALLSGDPRRALALAQPREVGSPGTELEFAL